MASENAKQIGVRGGEGLNEEKQIQGGGIYEKKMLELRLRMNWLSRLTTDLRTDNKSNS